jgi:hypothetical protein
MVQEIKNIGIITPAKVRPVESGLLSRLAGDVPDISGFPRNSWRNSTPQADLRPPLSLFGS